jgi:hypothetical protein
MCGELWDKYFSVHRGAILGNASSGHPIKGCSKSISYKPVTHPHEVERICKHEPTYRDESFSKGARLRKKKMLKLRVRRTVGKAYSAEEKARMLTEARKARAPHIYLALNLALNAGMRDAEIRNITG